ncbi:MAG TPA: HlyD family secretion protein [bacterium]|jgi:membrane fusion protein (multidrug efflux system)|nr:HlyD family secretion protein [bacterium]
MSKKNSLLLLFACVALTGLGVFVYNQMTWESTDDAYVQAHVLMLAPRVGGTVSKVLVDENEPVKAGQLLVEFEGQDYATAFDQAQADVASLQADAAQAKLDFDRASKLIKEGVVTRQEYDQARSKSEGLDERLKAAVFKAKQAGLNLSYTNLIAPEDGVIAKRAVEPGMVVPAGQPLLGFVASDDRWVTANFKETQLSLIRPGRYTEVTVDAVPGRVFKGEVDSLSSGTGSIFTLLPPDNSTGNFTKVVQRVPVKIKLDGLTGGDIALLQAGLSAVVSVRVR